MVFQPPPGAQLTKAQEQWVSTMSLLTANAFLGTITALHIGEKNKTDQRMADVTAIIALGRVLVALEQRIPKDLVDYFRDMGERLERELLAERAREGPT